MLDLGGDAGTGRHDLATAIVRLYERGWGIDGASDHTTHGAVYLHDPDHNGIELAWDREPDYWRPRYAAAMANPDQIAAMQVFRSPLDFDSLLAELEGGRGAAYLPTLRSYR